MIAHSTLSINTQDPQLSGNSSEGAAGCQPSLSVFWSPSDKGHNGLGLKSKTVPFHGRSHSTTVNYYYVSDPS